MKVKVRRFRVQKAGNKPEEYEDAFAVHEGGLPSSHVFRVAVADGATETSFSGLWARLLAKSFASGRLTWDNLASVQRDLETIWKKQVGSKPLPWYAEQKLESGAFAAFAGLELSASGTWHAIAIGDCCVFHLRGSELEDRFPIASAADFDNRPLLLCSLSKNNGTAIEQLHRLSGRWERGDTFFLMSDAIAAWFLRQFDAHADPASWLEELDTEEGFTRFVSQQRQDVLEDSSPVMRNDDVTLVICNLS